VVTVNITDSTVASTKGLYEYEELISSLVTVVGKEGGGVEGSKEGRVVRDYEL